MALRAFIAFMVFSTFIAFTGPALVFAGPALIAFIAFIVFGAFAFAATALMAFAFAGPALIAFIVFIVFIALAQEGWGEVRDQEGRRKVRD